MVSLVCLALRGGWQYVRPACSVVLAIVILLHPRKLQVNHTRAHFYSNYEACWACHEVQEASDHSAAGLLDARACTLCML